MKTKIFFGEPKDVQEEMNAWFATTKDFYIVEALQSQHIPGEVVITIIYQE
jgi:Mlc titration factor MtfA (ptsG expression regulator)